MVKCLPIHTRSVPSEPGESVYPGGGTDWGAASGVKSMEENCWTRRTSMNEASLYANCGVVRKSVACMVSKRERERNRAYLLTETDTGPGVEGEEDERVRREVLVQPFVQEAIRVELQSYVTAMSRVKRSDLESLPSGPQRSFLRCMTNTE